MYPNLEAEISRMLFHRKSFSEYISMPYTTFLGKIKGQQDFTLDEAFAIRNKINSNLTLEYLFAKSENEEEREGINP